MAELQASVVALNKKVAFKKPRSIRIILESRETTFPLYHLLKF
jgi:hypothetical protein